MIPVYEKNSGIDLQPWYSYQGENLQGKLPAFFDDADWNWMKECEADFISIKTEIENLLNKKAIRSSLISMLPSPMKMENGKRWIFISGKKQMRKIVWLVRS